MSRGSKGGGDHACPVWDVRAEDWRNRGIALQGEKRISLKDYRFHGKVKEAEEGGAGRANYIKVISPVKTFPLVVSLVPWDNIQICPEWRLCSCLGALTGGSGREVHERRPEGTLLPPFHLPLSFDFARSPLEFHGG